MPRRKSLVTAWSRALARLRDHGLLLVALASLALVVDGCPRFGRQTAPPAPPPAFQKINHINVIYLENRSFDNLFGLFPGANGIAAAGSAATQRDPHGLPYEFLPPVMNVGNGDEPTPDLRFPETPPTAPSRFACPSVRRRVISSTASTRSRSRSTTAGWTGSRLSRTRAAS